MAWRIKMSSQYWLVSLPLEGGNADRTWSILQDKTCHDNDLSVNYRVCPIPLLRLRISRVQRTTL